MILAFTLQAWQVKRGYEEAALKGGYKEIAHSSKSDPKAPMTGLHKKGT